MEPDRLFAHKAAKVIKQRGKAQKLSLLIPGLGQFYEGRRLTGAFIFSTFAFPFYYWYLLNFPTNYGSLALFTSQFLLYVLQAYDAGKGKRRESSPCEDFCPAEVKIPSFMALCERGELEKAFGIFFLSSPFPFILGELCPAPCEGKCGILPERPLKIREVHREMAKKVLENIKVRERPPFFPEVGKKVAVIGGGIAGITVAYYLASVGIHVDLFERENSLGGILNVIPEFKVDKTLSRKEIDYATSFKNLKIYLNSEIKEKPKGYDAVVLSVGAQKEKKLDEKLIRNFKGKLIYPLEFLKNPPLLKGKRLAVIGAGDTALDVSRLAVRRGAEVVVLYRGESSTIRANKKELAEAVKEGVRIYTNCDLKGSEDSTLIFSCGNFSPNYIVPAIGFEVDRKFISKFEGKDVFITGDAETGMTTFVEALGRARKTAYDILKKLKLEERAWFTVDFYFSKPKRSFGSNLFVTSESSLCQHCGIRVKS